MPVWWQEWTIYGPATAFQVLLIATGVSSIQRLAADRHQDGSLATCCSVLQCVAVCCSVLQYKDYLQTDTKRARQQHVAACCSVLLRCRVAARVSIPVASSVCCSVLQRVAACCSVLQRGAACCSMLQRQYGIVKHILYHGQTLLLNQTSKPNYEKPACP